MGEVSSPVQTPWYAQFDWRILLLFLSLAILASLYTRHLHRIWKALVLIGMVGLYYFVLYWSTHQ